MQNQHTPGPWEGEGWLTISRTAESTICQISKPYASKYVEHHPMGLDVEHLEEARANHRLINAAPEMLELLELAQYAIEAAWLAGITGANDLCMTLDGVDKDKFYEARTKLRDLIAKVRGNPTPEGKS